MVKGIEDKIFNTIVYVLLALSGASVVFPLMYVLSVSVTPVGEVLKNGGFILIPRSVTFTAYAKLLSDSVLVQSIGVTVFITVVGTVLNLILTALTAYPLSSKQLPGRKAFLFLIVFTLIFNGGIIPTYITVKSVGLLDSAWAMILPNVIWSFNVLVMKSFFENLPDELFDAANIDGAGDVRVLWQIVLPLSMPVMMTVGLFYMVGHWNEFFQAIMYVTDRTLFPLQVVVRDILMQSQQPLDSAENIVPTQTMQMASVVLASLPIILVYPFIQRKFTKGLLLGAVKG
ncbi:Trehalose transport system permease protein SugB [Paenibacillus konkukensis]|uniref:Trehalose transport system permease protein SugB n=1 Tax=Paenibacillus konkukensis TaxID=2020716 RepID=A0ABY4RYX1_9BACL|nr:carbohydrate ABC transporter permease [Paenibacillus konkukensis]UQZ87516.1 Trehalose transport system permease protein SugB [Paenibacillus konkukensis]